MASRHEDLPRKEPDTFSGSIYDYPAWINSFEALVERRKPLASDRLYYLGKYTTGEAKEAIRSLLTLQSDEAYTKAKNILAKRYGDKLIVADTYRKKISDWPQIKYGDGKALRKFSDFLLHCETAMTTISYLKVLDDAEEHKKILRKLPQRTVDRWIRIVDSWMNNPSSDELNERGEHIHACDMCKFLDKEACIICIPANPKPEDNKKEDAKVGRSGKYSNARSLNTGTDEVKQSASKDQTSSLKITSNTTKPCILCKAQHNIESCQDFLKMKLTDRQSIVITISLMPQCYLEPRTPQSKTIRR